MLGTLNFTGPQVDAILAALIDTGGPFDPAGTWLGVYTSVDPHGLDTVLADFTMPTGDLADRQPLAWGTQYQLQDGSAVVDSVAQEYVPGAGEDGTIGGVYLADAATAGNVLGWITEAPSVPVDENHIYTAVFRLVVDPTGRWSVSLSWNG